MTPVYIQECRLSNGLVIHSDSRTPVHHLIHDIYRKCVYTPPDFPHLKANDVVIDLGANIGVFALYAACISPTVCVHAFEPVPQSFALLQQNAAVNNLPNVHCYSCSVSGITGKNTLYISNTGSTSDTTMSTRIPAQGAARAESVDCLSLNDLFGHCGIDKCDFLKVDIEGSEFAIFRAASLRTLQRIEKIAMEYHEMGCGQGQQLADLLQRSGFQVEIIPELGSDRGMIYAVKATTRRSESLSNSVQEAA